MIKYGIAIAAGTPQHYPPKLAQLTLIAVESIQKPSRVDGEVVEVRPEVIESCFTWYPGQGMFIPGDISTQVCPGITKFPDLVDGDDVIIGGTP